MKYKKITFGTLAFFISSFVIQGFLGFTLAGILVGLIYGKDKK